MTKLFHRSNYIIIILSILALLLALLILIQLNTVNVTDLEQMPMPNNTIRTDLSFSDLKTIPFLNTNSVALNQYQVKSYVIENYKQSDVLSFYKNTLENSGWKLIDIGRWFRYQNNSLELLMVAITLADQDTFNLVAEINPKLIEKAKVGDVVVILIKGEASKILALTKNS